MTTTTPPVSRPAHWKIADVLDFEILLSGDAGRAGERQLLAGNTDRRSVFRAWLDARRAEAKTALPGEHFTAGWQTLLTLAVIAGLALGGSVTAALLHYQGHEPLNVLDFLAWTLGPQALFLAAGVLLWIERRTTRFLDDWRPLRTLLDAAILLFSLGLKRLPGETRDRFRAGFANLTRKREIYGALAAWPAVILTQLFAVCFNAGILATLFLHVSTQELRFGWETTLEVEDATAARVVAAISSPWSWASNAAPTAAQITATRYAPGQRHDTLAGDAMRAWWPFLFYAVACYGLALRAALLVFAAARLRAALRALRFDHADANALWRRLSGPPFETPCDTAHIAIPSGGSVENHPHTPGACVALVAHGLALDEAALRQHLATALHWQLTQILPVKIDDRHECAPQLAALRAAAQSLAGVAIVVPVERDPIVAIALFLRDAIAAAGTGPEVLIVLHGPHELAAERLQFWRNFNAIHGLHLGIECWT